jgi:hypothetical protein
MNCGLRGQGVGAAPLAQTIRNNESILVGRKLGGDVRSVGNKVNGTGNVASFVGLRAVRIENGNIFVRDGPFQRLQADVRKRTGKCGGGKNKSADENALS